MSDIVERLRFDAVRCEMQFSKGVAGNIEEAVAEIERLHAALGHIGSMPDGAYDAETAEFYRDARWFARETIGTNEQKASTNGK